jgi:hypothetical protein
LTIKLPIFTELELNPIIGLVSILRSPEVEIPKLLSPIHLDMSDANLYMSQFNLFTVMGSYEFALEMQTKALERSLIYRIQSNQKPIVRLLALMCPGDANENTPLDYLIENSDIRLDLMYILEDRPLPEVIPDHDVAIIALCASQKTKPLLDKINKFIMHWPRPVLNYPNCIMHCYRDTLYQSLKSIPKVQIPPTVNANREELEKITKLGFSLSSILIHGNYPITIRPLDFHSGKEFCKIENKEELTEYLRETNENDFFISSFVNYCDTDGFYRKARIALIDGHPYVCHLAISSNWLVHYKTADMIGSESKRQEEATFMKNFDTEFALRHQDALTSISDRLGLDYAVIDCAETSNGDLLVFEIDNVGWVHATDPVDIFPYKQIQMNRVFAAFQAMLIKNQRLEIKNPLG